jgi:hypothetical protein
VDVCTQNRARSRFIPWNVAAFCPPGESKQKEVRYVDIHEVDPLDEAQLATWIQQAAALPGWAP